MSVYKHKKLTSSDFSDIDSADTVACDTKNPPDGMEFDNNSSRLILPLFKSISEGDTYTITIKNKIFVIVVEEIIDMPTIEDIEKMID